MTRVDLTGMTPLMFACKSGCFDLIETLVHGIKPITPTAISNANLYRGFICVHAEVDQTNRWGKRAADYAIEANRPEKILNIMYDHNFRNKCGAFFLLTSPLTSPH